MQFGAGLADGVLRHLASTRMLAAHFPPLAMAALDVKNAFGAMSRDAMREAVGEDIPRLLTLSTCCGPTAAIGFG